MKIDPSEVKRYPGSSRGPRPEDDPDHYAAWWEKHKPSVFRHPMYYDLEEMLEKEEKVYTELLAHLKDQNEDLKNYRMDITKKEQELEAAKS